MLWFFKVTHTQALNKTRLPRPPTALAHLTDLKVQFSLDILSLSLSHFNVRPSSFRVNKNKATGERATQANKLAISHTYTYNKLSHRYLLCVCVCVGRLGGRIHYILLSLSAPICLCMCGSECLCASFQGQENSIFCASFSLLLLLLFVFFFFFILSFQQQQPDGTTRSPIALKTKKKPNKVK